MQICSRAQSTFTPAARRAFSARRPASLIFRSGGENTVTAMHGDRVVARLITDPSATAVLEDRRRREGRVIRILERANETVVEYPAEVAELLLCRRRRSAFVHNLYVPAPVPPLFAVVGDKVVAKLDSWPSRHVNPEGHVLEVLGRAGSPGVACCQSSGNTGRPVLFPTGRASRGRRFFLGNSIRQKSNAAKICAAFHHELIRMMPGISMTR